MDSFTRNIVVVACAAWMAGSAQGQIAAPTIIEVFGASVIPLNGTTAVSFTIGNPDLKLPLNGVGFSSTLPSGLMVAAPNGLIGDCGGGTIAATSGSSSISLSNASLAAGTSCRFAVNVTGIAVGEQDSTVFAISANGGNSAIASASVMVQPPNAHQIGYASNLPIGDSLVNIANSGNDVAGNLCVNVYTFDSTQNLTACCACPVAPNGLKSLSVRRDLISNTLTLSVPNSITIKLLATSPVGGTCDAGSPTASNLVEGMHAWSTTLHSRFTVPASYASAEEDFQSAYLSPGALTQVTTLCKFIQGDGGGYGICKSCRAGALGAEQR